MSYIRTQNTEKIMQIVHKSKELARYNGNLLYCSTEPEYFKVKYVSDLLYNTLNDVAYAYRDDRITTTIKIYAAYYHNHLVYSNDPITTIIKVHTPSHMLFVIRDPKSGLIPYYTYSIGLFPTSELRNISFQDFFDMLDNPKYQMVKPFTAKKIFRELDSFLKSRKTSDYKSK